MGGGEGRLAGCSNEAIGKGGPVYGLLGIDHVGIVERPHMHLDGS